MDQSTNSKEAFDFSFAYSQPRVVELEGTSFLPKSGVEIDPFLRAFLSAIS
jgi:hypothetical protein